MSTTEEDILGLEQRQQKIGYSAEEQAKKGTEASTKLQQLKVTQLQLINKHSLDALNKWETLTDAMIAAEAKALKHASRSDLRKKLSMISYKHKKSLPISDVLNALDQTRRGAQSLKDRASELELSASNLFSDSSMLEEDILGLEGSLQSYSSKIELEQQQLGYSQTANTEKMDQTDWELNRTGIENGNASRRSARSEKWHDRTKWIPVTNLITYPVTKIVTRHYDGKVATTGLRIDHLKKEQDRLTELLNDIQVQIEQLQSLRKRVADVAQSRASTSAQAEQTKQGAQALAQMCADTIDDAVEIIQPVNAAHVKLSGKGARLYMQERCNIILALEKHLQHIDSSGSGMYSSSTRNASRKLQTALTNLRNCKFLEYYKRSFPEIGSDKLEL